MTIRHIFRFDGTLWKVYARGAEAIQPVPAA